MTSASSGLPHRDDLLTLDDIVARKLTKKRLVWHHYKPEKYTVDLSVPKTWIDKVANHRIDEKTLLFTTVWLYPDKSESPKYWLTGLPAVLCEDTATELLNQKIEFYTPIGFKGNDDASATG